MSDRKKSRNFPAKNKLRDVCRQVLKHSAFNNRVGVPKFSLNLDFENFENETPNKRVKKKCEKRNLIKVLKTRKVSMQAGQHNFHYVPWQACMA